MYIKDNRYTLISYKPPTAHLSGDDELQRKLSMIPRLDDDFYALANQSKIR